MVVLGALLCRRRRDDYGGRRRSTTCGRGEEVMELVLVSWVLASSLSSPSLLRLFFSLLPSLFPPLFFFLSSSSFLARVCGFLW